MNILVTGASGFVGKHLVNFLLKKGANIYSLGRNPSVGTFNFPLSLPWRQKDIFSIVKKVQPDYFFHLAGNSQTENIKESVEINASLSQILLDAIAYYGFQNKTKCLLFGSAAEYGKITGEDLPITEKFKCSPSSSYGISKLNQTNYALNWSKAGGSVIIIRPFSIFGPFMPANLAVGNFSKQIRAIAKKELKRGTIYTGNINVSRDFVDVKDVIEICWKLINIDKEECQIINVCSGKALKLINIIEFMADLTGLELSIEVSDSLLRSNDPLAHYGNNDKLINLIGDYKFTPWKVSVKSIMGVA